MTASTSDAEFGEFVASRTQRLRQFAYICCGDWHRAEDTVQTALVRLYLVWGRPKHAVDAYVRRIIVNLLINERRRLRFTRERVSDRLPEPPGPDAADATTDRVTVVGAMLRLAAATARGGRPALLGGPVGRGQREDPGLLGRRGEEPDHARDSGDARTPVGQRSPRHRRSRAMTRDLRRSIDEAFATMTPPSAITRDVIIHKGRRLRRRRRFAFAGGATSVVAAVTALLLAFPVGGSTPPPAGVTQPEFPLPTMDPDADYVWSPMTGLEPVTDATAATDDAWRAAFAAAAAETGADVYVNVDPSAPTGAEWVPFSEAGYSPVVRRENRLFRVVGGSTWAPDLEETGYVAPYFWGGDLALSRDPGQQADVLSVRVLANGSFLPGAGQPYSSPVDPPAPYAVAGCEDYTYHLDAGSSPIAVDYTCADLAGPAGERVLVVETALAKETGTFHRELAVVLYRADGTAVVVQDSLTSFDIFRPATLPDATILDAARLLDIALAMPSVVVG